MATQGSLMLNHPDATNIDPSGPWVVHFSVSSIRCDRFSWGSHGLKELCLHSCRVFPLALTELPPASYWWLKKGKGNFQRQKCLGRPVFCINLPRLAPWIPHMWNVITHVWGISVRSSWVCTSVEHTGIPDLRKATFLLHAFKLILLSEPIFNLPQWVAIGVGPWCIFFVLWNWAALVNKHMGFRVQEWVLGPWKGIMSFISICFSFFPHSLSPSFLDLPCCYGCDDSTTSVTTTVTNLTQLMCTNHGAQQAQTNILSKCPWNFSSPRLAPFWVMKQKSNESSRTGILQGMFSDQGRTKVEINHRKLSEKPDIGQFNSTLENNLWTREMTKQIGKCYELDEYGNTTQQNLWKHHKQWLKNFWAAANPYKERRALNQYFMLSPS